MFAQQGVKPGGCGSGPGDVARHVPVRNTSKPKLREARLIFYDEVTLF